MSRLLRCWIAPLFMVAVGLVPDLTRGETRNFSAGSIIIPMDSCYQPAQDTVQPAGCAYGRTAQELDTADGPIKAYGLVYRLLQRGITVHVITNPDKTSISAVDFTVTNAGGSAPVGIYNRATRVAQELLPPGRNQISYLGAPFVIDVANAGAVLDMLNRDPVVSAFTSVVLHIAYTSFSAPVAMRMNGTPPRIAVFQPPTAQGGSSGTDGLPLMRGYMIRAGLDPGGSQAPQSDLFDMVTASTVGEANFNTRYRVTWLPHFDAYNSDSALLDRFAAFADSGGMIFAECASIRSFESYSNTRFTTNSGLGDTNMVETCFPGNRNGNNSLYFNRRGKPATTYTTCWDPGQPEQTTQGASLRYPVPTNPFVQIGDFRFYKIFGTTQDWKASGGNGLRAFVRPLIQTWHETENSKRNQIIMSVANKDGNANKGQIIYFGGHFYGDPSGPSTAGIRIVLNTLLFARPSPGGGYLARSGPTVLPVDGRTLLFQGTYLENTVTLQPYSRSGDALTWPFPQVLGRFQAYDTALLSSTQALGGTTGLVFDSADQIPGALLRRLYSSRGTGTSAQLVELTPSGLSSRGDPNPFALTAGYSSADTDALTNKLRGAPLGGIDHSQSAVVGPQSLVPGGANRPTVAYVGALDGMVHAFHVAGGSTVPGTELWGFLPGEQLLNVRTNGVAMDASPSVGDIFDRIGDARRWRTLLVMPQGRGGTAVYGMDVSDPTAPSLLWVRGTNTSGVPLGYAAGAAMTIHPTPTNPFQSFIILATSTPTGASGVTVTALSGADGSQLWQWRSSYSRFLPRTSAVVPNDMPAPVAIGSSGGRYQDRVYVADLEGRVWELETTTGRNVNGTAPLADVGLTANNYTQPIGAQPVLYIDTSGQRSLLVVTGGTDWADPGETYAVYAYNLDPSVRSTNNAAGVAPRRFRTAMAAGLKGFSPPSVSGNDVYLMGSSGVINGAISSTVADSAMLYRINLSSSSITSSLSLTKGAGAFLTAQGGVIYGSTARDLVVSTPAGADTRARALIETAASPLRHRVWLENLF